MAKVAQSATAMWPKPCQVSHEVGPGTFFKQKIFFRDVIQIFFSQGRKSKLAQITGTIIIFKPFNYKILSFSVSRGVP